MCCPVPHQVIESPSRTAEPETARELPPLTTPAQHEVPLCPLPNETDTVRPHHGSLPLTSFEFTIACSAYELSRHDRSCVWLTLQGSDNRLLKSQHNGT